MIRTFVWCLVLLLLMTGQAWAQIPVPAGPVLVCGSQAMPSADSYQVAFDGGAPTAVTMEAAVDSACPAGSTHSFRLAPALFTIGQHTIAVAGSNAFGSTTGPTFTVTVGIAPGPFTIGAVIAQE
jgi:hypothetical protein